MTSENVTYSITMCSMKKKSTKSLAMILTLSSVELVRAFLYTTTCSSLKLFDIIFLSYHVYRQHDSHTCTRTHTHAHTHTNGNTHQHTHTHLFLINAHNFVIEQSTYC